MSENEMEQKVKALERIINALTYSEEITYHGFDNDGHLVPWIEFHEADPEKFKLVGFDEGLELSWSSEIYEREGIKVLGEDEVEKDSRMVAEVWVHEDLYKKVEDLEKQLRGLQGKVIE